MMAIRGVDISEHNGSVDFQALKSAGVGFVIIRLGYGSDYPQQDDACYIENVRKAETAGMPWGAYLYSYAKNADMAKSEARHALRLLSGKKPLYGVWFDVEDSQISNVDLVSTCQSFCDSMEAAGVYAGIYSSLSWFEGPLSSSRLDKYDKWVAQWNSVCEYKKPYGIWQYTDNLTIGGRAFDGNFAYKDYPAIVKAMNGKGEDEMAYTYEDWKAHMKRYEAEKANMPVADWAKDAVNYAKSAGLMNGDANGNFRPQSNITRQEVAVLLKNASEKK